MDGVDDLLCGFKPEIAVGGDHTGEGEVAFDADTVRGSGGETEGGIGGKDLNSGGERWEVAGGDAELLRTEAGPVIADVGDEAG